jgi:hypothetical protein
MDEFLESVFLELQEKLEKRLVAAHEQRCIECLEADRAAQLRAMQMDDPLDYWSPDEHVGVIWDTRYHLRGAFDADLCSRHFRSGVLSVVDEAAYDEINGTQSFALSAHRIFGPLPTKSAFRSRKPSRHCACAERWYFITVAR